MDNNEFLIPLNGLASGRKDFRWRADKEFFGSFGNADILDADLVAEVSAEKAGRSIDVDCRIEGTVTVRCDRCMEDLVLPVDSSAGLRVKFGEEPEGGEDGTEDGREAIYLPSSDSGLDMRQVIYDYACLALPMQRFHKDGKCNPDVISRLESGISIQGTESQVNPFSALAGLFDGEGGRS